MNLVVQDYFDAVELTHRPDGVLIAPVLAGEHTDRLVEDPSYRLAFGGRDVVREPATGALVSFAEPEEELL